LTQDLRLRTRVCVVGTGAGGAAALAALAACRVAGVEPAEAATALGGFSGLMMIGLGLRLLTSSRSD
jgi:cation diffusion facilitator CzcD-associated flavoprotein CzcO